MWRGDVASPGGNGGDGQGGNGGNGIHGGDGGFGGNGAGGGIFVDVPGTLVMKPRRAPEG